MGSELSADRPMTPAPKRLPGRPKKPGGPRVEIRAKVSQTAVDKLRAWGQQHAPGATGLGDVLEALIARQ